MKNILKVCLSVSLFLVIFSMFISCTSCAFLGIANNVTDAGLVDASVDASIDVTDTVDVVVTLPDHDVIKGDSWQINLPVDADKTFNLQQDIVLSAMVQDVSSFVVTLTKQSFPETYDSYLIYSSRNLKASGLTVASSNMVNNNGQEYTLFSAHKDELSVWTWVTVKGQFGYSLSCGGSKEDEFLQDVCTQLFNSLVLY